ncbi:MAG: transposase [Pelosinus sp.]|jgi:transposase|nr:transposase [Pelosinus sp.]
MTKYNSEFKLKTVEAVLNDGRTAREASATYGVNKADVQKWVAAYQAHGLAGIEKKRVSYSGEFKQAVIEDMRENGLSMRQTAAKYNLGNHTIVAKWERIYLEEGVQGLYVERRGQSARTKEERSHKLSKEKEEDLIAENQRLRMEVEYLKKLNALVQERERLERNIKRK